MLELTVGAVEPEFLVAVIVYAPKDNDIVFLYFLVLLYIRIFF